MTDECNIALVVGSNADGSFGTDSGLWRGIAERGKAVLDYCFLHEIEGPHGRRDGGHGVAGTSI